MKLHIYITKDLYQRLKRLAEKHDRSVSYLVARAAKLVYSAKTEKDKDNVR